MQLCQNKTSFVAGFPALTLAFYRCCAVPAALAAVRAAPGEVARRLAWLGSIGDGVSVELPETGPAVVIRIDGRPWRMASRGRLICADAHLRRAFSAALGVPTLPIIIDDRQSWTGPIDIAGPVIGAALAVPLCIATRDEGCCTFFGKKTCSPSHD